MSLFQTAASNPSFVGRMLGIKSSKSNGSRSKADVTYLDCDDEALREMENWSSRLKYAMCAVSLFIIITAFYSFGSISGDISTTFIALYVFFFGILIMCYEIALKFMSVIIVQNFGFLYNPYGRSIFLLLLSILCYHLGAMGIASFAFLIVAIFLHGYIDLRYPKFEKYLQIKHFHGRVTNR